MILFVKRIAGCTKEKILEDYDQKCSSNTQILSKSNMHCVCNEDATKFECLAKAVSGREVVLSTLAIRLKI